MRKIVAGLQWDKVCSKEFSKCQFYEQKWERINDCSSGKGVTVLPWRNSIEEAQADLDEYAHKHKMTVVDIT